MNNNVKSNCDSGEFEQKINKFLSKFCRETDTHAAVCELNNSDKEQVEETISK